MGLRFAALRAAGAPLSLTLHILCSYHQIENQTGYGIRLLSGKPLLQSCVIEDYVNLAESPKLKIEINFQF